MEWAYVQAVIEGRPIPMQELVTDLRFRHQAVWRALKGNDLRGQPSKLTTSEKTLRLKFAIEAVEVRLKLFQPLFQPLRLISPAVEINRISIDFNRCANN